MRIVQLHITSQYKNLKNFKLDFDGKSFIDVFVGKNGTGKSNLFEALIEIFRHLFEREYIIPFEYLLKYEIEGKLVEVNWSKDRLYLDTKEVKLIPKGLLPDDIIIYYSGHNNKITELVRQYEDNFKKTLKEANEGDTREFIGIGKEYKALLLAVLLLQPDSNKAKEFIRKKLSIKSIGDELKIVLKRPYYAQKRGYEIDRVDRSSNFWKADGITRKFLDVLTSVKPGDAKGRARDEGYFAREEYSDEYILYFDIKEFQKAFGKLSAQQLFREFDNLKTIEMLGDISIEIGLESGNAATINHFSDGQFQTVYIYSIIELFKDRNCITLLDEPDSFLHPEWQFDFFKQVLEITEKTKLNNHVLMSSHSASTISRIDEGYLNLFEFNGSNVSVSKLPKSGIIKSLSAGLISFTEGEAQLNINHFLNNTSGAVLFTEGITDEMILETAWNKLFPTTKPNFEIQNAYSCAFLRNTVKDESLYSRYPKKIFFSLFDFDEAFHDWNQLGTDIEVDPHKCLTKKLKAFESYSLLMPVPKSAISKQVLNANNGKTYGGRSLLTIELLFHGVPGLDKYFVVDQERTDGFVKFISDGQKVKFAEEEVPKIDAKYFEVFRPIFDFIKTKC
jgi:ABC-type Mn2+/Zn2+ transport system ATPase subunit